MKLIQEFKRVLRRLTPAEMAAAELAEAELKLLEAQTGREYADAMVTYHTARIARLKRALVEMNAEIQATERSRGA